jgi:hypothetical protein
MQQLYSGARLAQSIRNPEMRKSAPLFALVLAAWPATAQPKPQTPKPYAPVAITRPQAFDDASFAAFRRELAAAAKSRLYARLAGLVSKHDFFWDRDFGRELDPHKPAIDNLAAAIALEHDNGSGWAKLATFAANAMVEPLDSRMGVICAPAAPAYDSVAYAKLLDTTYTTPIDWAYPRTDETPVRGAPNADADAIGTLGPTFVRLLGFAGPDSEADPGRKLWARIAMPDGKSGFVAPGSLLSLTAERLCYAKDAAGGWKITGFIAGGR